MNIYNRYEPNRATSVTVTFFRGRRAILHSSEPCSAVEGKWRTVGRRLPTSVWGVESGVTYQLDMLGIRDFSVAGEWKIVWN